MNADDFIAAMQTLERDGDVGALAGLYADDCTVGNVLEPEAFQGRSGAEEFWRRYRATFDQVESTYRTVVDDGTSVALEWDSTATVDGRSISYRGVTVIEQGDGGITRTCAYYDPAQLGSQLTS